MPKLKLNHNPKNPNSSHPIVAEITKLTQAEKRFIFGLLQVDKHIHTALVLEQDGGEEYSIVANFTSSSSFDTFRKSAHL